MPSVVRSPALTSLLLLSMLALAGCPGEAMPPGGDAGPGGGDAGPSADAPVAPGTDAPMPAADAPMMLRDVGPRPDVGPVDAGPDPVPAFCTGHPELTDAALAMQALRILGSTDAGATTRRCNECHTLSRARINHWRALSDTAISRCIGDGTIASDAAAAAMLTCLEDPEAGEITSAELGIWATGAGLEWFQYLFRHGVTGDWATAHGAFVDGAGMPPPDATTATALSQDEFEYVCDWFLRGVPALESIVPTDPVSGTCLPGISDPVRTHVAAMATDGWGARNRAAGMLMYGCGGATGPEGCLASEPLASSTAFGANWNATGTAGVPGARLRVLYTTSYATAWWTRTSPDGRFVSHGAATAPNLRFVDLTSDRVIGGAADYDPDFFPDGSGFMVQGGRSGARVCESRVLTTGTPTMLAFTEPGCSSAAGVGLYQHVGASLSGGDYWAIASNDAGSEYDNGGQNVTRTDPIASYTATANVTFTFFTNDGTMFVRGTNTSVTTPWEGDHVLSPSLSTILTRVAGPGGAPMGYVLRRIDATRAGSGWRISLPEIGRYCLPGAKPSISYDERFFATHHYIGDDDADARELGFTGLSDPGFAEYRMRGAANAYLVDMLTGAQYRITNMGPGQYALFPHFRSDGWIYMTVRTEGATPEHIVASDAALLIP